jgi:hypothetical protein
MKVLTFHPCHAPISDTFSSLHFPLVIELFDTFSMKVFPKDVLQQFLNRPTINDFKDCQQQLRILLEQHSCAPLFVMIPSS